MAYSLRELLPGSTGLRIYGLLLLGWYLFWGFLLKPTAIPGVFHGQLTVWLIYAFVLFIFVRCLQQSRGEPLEPSDTGLGSGGPFAFSWRGFVLSCAVATAVTTVSRLLLFPFVPLQVLLMLTLYVVAGLALFAGTLRYISRPRFDRSPGNSGIR
jgi:hypothetical protein